MASRRDTISVRTGMVAPASGTETSAGWAETPVKVGVGTRREVPMCHSIGLVGMVSGNAIGATFWR